MTKPTLLKDILATTALYYFFVLAAWGAVIWVFERVWVLWAIERINF